MSSILQSVGQRFFGDNSSKFVKSCRQNVARINALKDEFAALSDDQLAGKTLEFKERIAKGETLNELLPEAFAANREAAKRALGLWGFDVQLIGGMALHHGKIAEMKTGEGKTLVATFATYLNALAGKGVHVVTVNDYLAKRDAEWMGQVFAKLGLTTSYIVNGQNPTVRKEAYAADITYATNNELGFDYLRDHMALSPMTLVQRPLYFAVVDEVDSILIDEARTPLIISGPSDDKTDLYVAVNDLIPLLREEEHYELDQKQKSANFTDAGIDMAESFLRERGLLAEDGNLYDVHNIALVHHANQALRAHTMFRKDVEYIIKPNAEGVDEVVLIDEFTGRMMAGRRLSEGLHQAIEAKERVAIKQENQTLASITFQNYFRLYNKLAGMTGTAATEAEEFESIYNLPVITMPTNVAVARIDEADKIYRNKQGKLAALVADIEDCNKRGQPVLVGTVTIEGSEELSQHLTKAGIAHNVLNARHHEQEANIIAMAGHRGAVTIATNMAGRGTDIKLGGNLELMLQGVESEIERAQIKERQKAEHDEVMAAGGLRVLGTERHESRRIDNQLRGRSGRQGDAGSSVFYLSLQDDLIKRFAPNLDALMTRLNMPEDEAIQHPWISKSIATAQRKIEALHFDMRKHVLKFDDVLNEQRKVIYEQRHEILHGEDLLETIHAFRTDLLDDMMAASFPANSMPEQWQPEVFREALMRTFNVQADVESWLASTDDSEEVKERARELVTKAWDEKLAQFKPEQMQPIMRMVLLQSLDQHWRQHLQALDILRRGINWRGYAQKDPINEFAKESFVLFHDLLNNIRQDTIGLLSRVQLVEEGNFTPPAGELLPNEPVVTAQPAHVAAANNYRGPTPADFGVASWDKLNPLDPRIPRNAPCPCGSGRRFKQCHGALGAVVAEVVEEPVKAKAPAKKATSKTEVKTVKKTAAKKTTAAKSTAKKPAAKGAAK